MEKNHIQPKFSIGQLIYVVTDPDQYLRMITGYKIRPYGIKYLVSYIDSESEFFDIELSEDKNILINLN
jgi:hypothetical protein